MQATGKRFGLYAATIMLSLLSCAARAQALQPYVLAYTAKATLASEAANVKSKLSAAGFEVVGEFSPYPGAQVIGISNPALRQMAAATQYGGFGAVEHVALTEVNGALQVSYLNPPYLAAAYRLKGDCAGISQSLKAALGAEQLYGTEKGRSAADLASFHYMLGMEHFDDFYKLGSHKSYEQAVQTVEANLKKNVGGAGLVYRVDIPGKQQTLFGVSRAKVSDMRANDKHIMYEVVDANFPIKTTAYLPYQMMVNGNEVIAMHMRFRMAVWHPDLTMVTFGKLMSSPNAIGDLLTQIAGGEKKFSF